MALPKILTLPGPATVGGPVPKQCAACGFSDLFRQPDFNRGVGLWLVGIAAALTVVFAIAGFNWWITWSPMPAFIIFDFSISKTSQYAVLCYKCEHIHRPKASKQEIEKLVNEFDLDHFDRVHYQDRIANSQN